MLLTIYNLPENTRYPDVKSLIETKCGIKDMILDHLVEWGTLMKVTVGLATDEDAAILVRKINGLFINGAQLHVEDVRKRKQAMEQPYYNTTRNEMYRNQLPERPSYMGQHNNQHNIQNNTDNSTNPNDYYAPNFTAYTPSAPPAQNMYNHYDSQPAAVQYPTPQRMYQAPNQPQQEPLGFRSEGNASPWSRNLGRNNEPPKTSFPQREVRWSPERGQRDERSQRRSGWGDDRSGRDGARRKSPPRDRRPYERESQQGTSRQPFNRENFRRSDNRSPQRANDRFAPKANRNSKPPAFGKPREFERSASFNHNLKQPKNNEQRRNERATNSHQPWSKTNPVSFKTQNWGEQADKPAKKRNFEHNTEDQPHTKIRRLPNLDEVKRPRKKIKRNYSAEEYAKLEAVRAETWRAQTAARIAKDMVEGKPITGGVEPAMFLKELKRMLRERLTGFCHPLMRHDGLYARYRKKYTDDSDEKLMEEAMESAKIVEAEFRAKMFAREVANTAVKSGAVKDEVIVAETPQAADCDVKVLNETKPFANSDHTFKVPLVPKLKSANPVVVGDKPKYTKGELSKFKRQKQQSKRVYNNQSLILSALDPKTAEALETESTLLLDKFLEECTPEGDSDSEEKVLVKRLTTTVAEDFKRVLKVQVARRILGNEEPLIRVFCSPKMLSRKQLSQFLEGQGITAIKKSTKHPMLLASCQSYEVHDRLCTSEPVTIGDRVISFKPLQIAGPPVRVTKDRIKQYRKNLINSQIDYSSDIDDNDIKFMSEIQEFQEKLEDSNEEPVEGLAVTKTEAEGISESDNTNKISSENVKKEIIFDDTTDNVKVEGFNDEANEMVALKDWSVDDYKIVEDTIGNFNNNEGTEGNIDVSDELDGENIDEEIGGKLDDGDELVAANIDDIEEGGEVVGGNIEEEDIDDEQDEGDEVDDDNCEDLDIGDVDENDLEDY